MGTPSRRAALTVAFVIALAATLVAAEPKDAFYRVPLVNLKLTEGELPIPDQEHFRWNWRLGDALRPRVVLDGPGEAVVTPANVSAWSWGHTLREGAALHVRAPEGQAVRGRLFLPNAEWTGMAVVRFEIAPAAATEEAKRSFYEAKRDHGNRLAAEGLPGAAWFRHEAWLASQELGEKAEGQPARPAAAWPGFAEDEVQRTYALFTGGRAVSENLQLDRLLDAPEAGVTDRMVAIDSIEGITVSEFDWKKLTEGMKPALDPLATKIPADQHVVFFPSFRAAAALADEADRQGTPLLRLAEPRSENALTRERYERQLGTSLDGLSRLLGPTVIKSVALTGSDSYYRTGTDVAVLFETTDADVLAVMLMAKITAAAAGQKDVQALEGEVAGLKYQGRRTPDRRLCAYVARLDGAVVLANSTHQLRRLAEVRDGKSPSLATLPEYVFFRDRYKLGDPEETALLFLSDATIRRWCGPRWRIGTSRRTRAAAVLAEMQASQMDELAGGQVEPGPFFVRLPMPDGARVRLTPRGVVSSVHGRLDFLTPIAEVAMDEVSKAEADAYERWRDGYQRNWTVGFDPIALRMGVKPEGLSADLSVMPLIAGSQYRQFVSLSQKAKIAPDAGDPHDAPLQVAVAIDREAPSVRDVSNFASSMVKGFSLGWMGDCVAFYADADPFWDELARTTRDDRDDFFRKQMHRLPVALNVEVKNGLALTGFLAGLRGFIEQTAPDMTVWETRKHHGESYVCVRPSEKAIDQNRESEKWTLCYSATGEALIVTPSETLLKRAIDRQIARRKAAAEGKPLEPASRPWLGENLALQADRSALEIVNGLWWNEHRMAMQVRAWNNLPILNVWHERYPDQDPVALHERVWGIRLECPGGGQYVWNDEWRTMESTVYGHPGQPKPGPASSPVLGEFARGEFGVSFPDQGLRARVRLERRSGKSEVGGRKSEK